MASTGDLIEPPNINLYYDYGKLIIARTDRYINFNWGDNSPHPSISKDKFAVRWTGVLEAKVSGWHTFYTNSDDGVNLWVNGQKIITNWTDHASKLDSGKIWLDAGQKYDIALLYKL